VVSAAAAAAAFDSTFDTMRASCMLFAHAAARVTQQVPPECSTSQPAKHLTQLALQSLHTTAVAHNKQGSALPNSMFISISYL
jgi:hypothetical protein